MLNMFFQCKKKPTLHLTFNVFPETHLFSLGETYDPVLFSWIEPQLQILKTWNLIQGNGYPDGGRIERLTWEE